MIQKKCMGFRCHSLVLGFIYALCCSVPVLQADDTEIFYGQAGSLDDGNPNLLFILDTSGSMNSNDGTSETRMDRLKDAMNAIIDQSSSFNVGMMGFSGWGKGGAVRYPVGYLEGTDDGNCPVTGCPDEVVLARVRGPNDDAVEDANTGAVTLDNQNIIMGEYPNQSFDTGIPADAVFTTATVAASAVTTEADRRLDGVVVNKNDEVTDSWFRHGDAVDFSPQRLAYRFNNLAIPAGAVITDAKLSLKVADGTLQTGTVSAYISAEATTTPSPYPDASLVIEPDPNPYIIDRITTSEFISWDPIPAGGNNEALETGNLDKVLQEVIGLPGWASGNDLSLIVEAFDSYVPGVVDNRQFHGVAATPAKVPELTYTYYTSASDTNMGSLTLTSAAHSLEYVDVGGVFNQSQIDPVADLFYQGDGDAADYALSFPAVNIPDSAVVTGAFLIFEDTGGAGSFKVNVAAEMSAAPEAYGIKNIADRVYTGNFSEVLLADAPGSVTTGDLKEIIEEARTTPGWTSGSTLSLRISPGADYLHDGSMLRKVATSASGTPPTLIINWEIPTTTVGDANIAQFVGMRFSNVHVPPGTIIKTAVLEFHSNSANAEVANLELRGEAISNSDSFEVVDYNISSRDRTIAGVDWVADTWGTVGTKFESVDVSSIVQELVDQSDWCGGNALSIIASGTGARDAIAYEQSSLYAPALRITFEQEDVPEGSYCSNRSSVVSVNQGLDDASENLSTDNVTLNAPTLDLVNASGAKGQLALRFAALPLPQGAKVTGATLELTAANDMTASTLTRITALASDDAPQVSSADATISSYTPGSASEDWIIPQALSGENIFSKDVTSIVSEVVNRTGWVKGNALTLLLEAQESISTTSFYSFDGDASLAPQLFVYYEVERTDKGTLFKENLKLAVNELVAQDGTPIVSAYYEGARYLRGQTVDYGKRRGWQNSRDRYHRVSHPFSYTGGTLSRPSGCSGNDLDAENCRWEEITGSPTYISPIQNQCQQNHIVLLSDGEATSNTADGKVRTMTGLSGCDTSYDSDEECGRELATWLKNTDHSTSLTGTQNIITHTIGFNLSTPQFLQDIAANGGGTFYPAESSDDLLQAFKNIFNSVSKRDTSFVAPSASVNQFNRLKHRDDLYFSLFKPEATARWDGNLKRYRLASSTTSASIVDKFGAEAINPATGEFNAATTSFWSDVVDGGVVTKGGAAAELASNPARKVVTYTGTSLVLMDASNRIATGNTNLKVTDFKLPPALEADADYTQDLLKWVAGYDVKDIDNDGDTVENRTQMGDPLHSEPLILNYAGATAGVASSVVFIATNEGYLHAINHSNGQEHFAFVPMELLPNMRYYFDNAVTDNRRYGIDGPITAWVKDTNNNGVIDTAAGEKAYLYFGLRRGGRDYYALDVSNPDNPKFVWHMRGQSDLSDSMGTTADGDYTDLVQTWSRMTKTKVRDGNLVKDVLIFGGGFDPSNHDASGTDSAGIDVNGDRKEDFLGTAIYIVDALTGNLLWRAEPDTDTDFTHMKYSIPSDITVIDIDSDGLADQLYAGDLGGQVWRIDINNDSSLDTVLSSRIRGGRIADFGGSGTSNRRRFFYAPDVAVVSLDGRQKLSISLGSGWRSHPLDVGVQERFYSFRMDSVFGPPVDSNGQIVYTTISETSTGMVDVTDQLNTDPSGKVGWYMDLEDSGEKVLAGSVTFNNQIVFTSYLPASTLSSCAAAVGSGRVYAVSVLNGDPVSDLDENNTSADPDTLTKSDRSDDLEHVGIPPAPVIYFPDVGDPVIMLGPELFDGIQKGEESRKTYWLEHVDSGY